MTVVLAWRAMQLAMCSKCGGVVLTGLKLAHHLRERLSPPAYCIGFHSHVAREHLRHPDDWEPPEEHLGPVISGQRIIPPVSAEFVHGELEAPRAVAPHERCTCGYYALWQPCGDSTNYGPSAERPYIWCYVMAIGKYVAYTEGVRMERYRLLRWWWPICLPSGTSVAGSANAIYDYGSLYSALVPKTWEEVARELAQRYGMPPVVGDPRRSELPVGVLSSLPGHVEDMLED